VFEVHSVTTHRTRNAAIGMLIVLLAFIAVVPNAFAAVTGQPVLSKSSLSWEASFFWRPCVIFTGSAYMMYYSGEDKNGVDGIGLVTSTDGVTWTRYAQNPVLLRGNYGTWESGSANEQWVVYEGGEYKMWYSGQMYSVLNKTILGYAIGYATSPDGIHWTKYSGNPVFAHGPPGAFDEKWVFRPMVIATASSYTMYYIGDNAAGDHSVGRASSSDGIHWSRTGTVPLPSSSWDSHFHWPTSVIAIGGQYLMAYSGNSAGAPQGKSNQIGFATSNDGVNWAPYTQNPVVTYGSGSWDSEGVLYPMVLPMNDQYYVYYSVYGLGSIGLAKIPISQIPIPEFANSWLIAVVAIFAVVIFARAHRKAQPH
jgi:predicted GH43/DUF377 family glycosyl hydrolase